MNSTSIDAAPRRADPEQPLRPRLPVSRARPVSRTLAISPEPEPRKSVRVFGLTLIVGFTVMGVTLSFLGHRVAAACVGSLGPVLGIPCLLWPERLRPLRDRWMQVAEFLGRINATVLLTLIYLVVVCPVGLLSKLVRRDALSRRFEPEARTYFTPRATEANPLDYFKQY